MNRSFFIRSLWIILASLLVSYLTVAAVSGNWNVFAWNTQLSERGKFIGEVVLVILFIIFRKKLKGD